MWGHNFTLIPCHNIFRWWWSVFVLSWLNRWNDFGGPGQTDRTFVFLCLTSVVLLMFDPLWSHNLTSFPITIYCNGGVRCAIIFWLHGWNDLVGSGRTVCKFVFCAYVSIIWVRSSVISYSHHIQCRRLVESMENLIGPGRTARTFVFLCLFLVLLFDSSVSS